MDYNSRSFSSFALAGLVATTVGLGVRTASATEAHPTKFKVGDITAFGEVTANRWEPDYRDPDNKKVLILSVGGSGNTLSHVEPKWTCRFSQDGEVISIVEETPKGIVRFARTEDGFSVKDETESHAETIEIEESSPMARSAVDGCVRRILTRILGAPTAM